MSTAPAMTHYTIGNPFNLEKTERLVYSTEFNVPFERVEHGGFRGKKLTREQFDTEPDNKHRLDFVGKAARKFIYKTEDVRIEFTDTKLIVKAIHYRKKDIENDALLNIIHQFVRRTPTFSEFHRAISMLCGTAMTDHSAIVLTMIQAELKVTSYNYDCWRFQPVGITYMSKPNIEVDKKGNLTIGDATFSAKKDDVHCFRVATSCKEYTSFLEKHLTEDERNRFYHQSDIYKTTSTKESVAKVKSCWFEIQYDLIAGKVVKSRMGEQDYTSNQWDFHYTYEAHKKSAPVAAFKEELAAYVFHPDRIARFSEKYGWGDPMTGSAGWLEMV